MYLSTVVCLAVINYNIVRVCVVWTDGATETQDRTKRDKTVTCLLPWCPVQHIFLSLFLHHRAYILLTVWSFIIYLYSVFICVCKTNWFDLIWFIPGFTSPLINPAFSSPAFCVIAFSASSTSAHVTTQLSKCRIIRIWNIHMTLTAHFLTVYFLPFTMNKVYQKHCAVIC